MALNSLQFNLSRAIGPVLAGMLLIYAGAGWCFTVNALSFLAVILALWRIQIPSPGLAKRESLAQSELVDARGSLSARLLELLGGFGGAQECAVQERRVSPLSC